MKHRLNGSGAYFVNVVRCPGDLNASHMVRLKSRLRRLISQRRKFFLMDLGEARYADLAGLGLLVDRIRHVRSMKGDIRLFNIRPEVREILKMVGLTGVIATYGNEVEARQSFQVA